MEKSELLRIITRGNYRSSTNETYSLGVDACLTSNTELEGCGTNYIGSWRKSTQKHMD